MINSTPGSLDWQTPCDVIRQNLPHLQGEARQEACLLLPIIQDRLYRRSLESSFEQFVREFWEEVPGAGKVQWNWHLSVICAELQAIAERVFASQPKLHDLVINISPGTSKSTLCSILFPPWTWTRYPQSRHISASHTETLVLDLALKARHVITSEKYQALWPHIQLRDDQASKGYYANTLGGDRLTCTVGGKSPTGFHAHFLAVDDPIDPKKAVSAAELKTAGDFMTNILPSRKVDKSISVTFLIMQRLHQEDPTGILLKKAKLAETSNIRHLLLPALLTDDISPPELAAHYVNKLMDPIRLPQVVLDDFRATLGSYSFAGQFLQSPIPLGGGMFKPQYFNNRVIAAPYEAKRIRAWDRASTKDGGCYTAGVLMAKDTTGNLFVEDCIHGQWEPDERNQRIRAAALKDRARYGPSHEPQIVIEAEGGSSGVDAWRAVARSLAGFNVRQERVTGKKDVRAEPWSCQLASGNVYMVEDLNNPWDLAGYIQEHLNFRPSDEGPLGRYKDMVDASSMAFNLLCGARQALGLRSFALSSKKQTGLRIVLCDAASLASLVLEQRCLLISIRDSLDSIEEVMCNEGQARNGRGQPGPTQLPDRAVHVNGAGNGCPTSPPLPPHGLSKLLDSVILTAADSQPAEHQDNWSAEVEQHLLTPAAVKGLWSKLLKHRDPGIEVIVIQDDGGDDRRAQSVALALCDVMVLPRDKTIYKLGHEDWQAKRETPPSNRHWYDCTKAARGLVV